MVQLSEEQRLQLDGIIQDMVDNGESEDNIQFVVEDFKSKQEGKTNATAKETAPVVAETPADTDLQLEDGSLELQQVDADKLRKEEEVRSKAAIEATRSAMAVANPIANLLPDALVPVIADWTAFTAETAAGVADTAEFAYDVAEPYAKRMSLNPAKTLIALAQDGGKISEEVEANIREQNLDMSGVYKAADALRQLRPKQYDDEGNELDAIGVAEQGDYVKAAGMMAEEALGSLPATVISYAAPGLGSAIIGAGTFGKELEKNLEERADEDTSDIVSNAAIKGGSEALFEFAGGKLFRTGRKLAGKGAEKAVKELTRNYALNIAKKATGGFITEGLTESATGLAQLGADEAIFNDEISSKQYIRTAVHSGIVGGLMGGPISGGAAAIQFSGDSKKKALAVVAPQSWRKNQLDMSNRIEETKMDLQQAPDSGKQYFEGKLQSLETQQQKNADALSERWDGLTRKEQIEYAKNVDKVNNGLGVINNNKYSKSSQEEAQIDIDDAYSSMERTLTPKNIDVETDQAISKTLKFAEKLASETKGAVLGIQKDDLSIKSVNDATAKEQYRMGNDDAKFTFKDGKAEIIINKDISSFTGATNAVNHELLHYAISKNFKTDAGEMAPLVNDFRDYLKNSYPEISEQVEDRIAKNYRDPETKEIDEAHIEEYLTVFSDLLATQKVSVDESLATKVKNKVTNLARGYGFAEAKLETGKDVFDFVRSYNENVVEKKNFKALDVKLTSSRVAPAEFKVDKEALSKSMDSVTFEEGSVNQEFQKFTYDGKKNTAPESFQAEAAMAYEPLAQAVVDRISKVGLGVSKEQDQFIMDYLADNQNKQDIVSDLTFGTERNKASSLLGLAKSYNPEVGSFGGYAKSQLANRAIRILEERVGKQVTQGAQTIDAPESREVAAEDQQMEIADTRNVFEKLNLPKEIVTKANKLAELASIKADKALTGKDVSDLKKVNARNKAFNDIFGKQLFKDIANELGKNTKTSNAFSQFVDKNFDSLSGIALENIDFQKGGGPAALWNLDNPPTKEEFLDYYEAKDEKTSTRSDRKKSLNNAIARQIGNEARIEFAKKDPSTAKLFKEKHGVVLASKSLQNLPSDKTLQTLAGIAGFKDGAGRPGENYWKAAGFDSKIGYDWGTDKGQNNFIKDFKLAVSKGMPLDPFMTQSKLFNSPRQLDALESIRSKAKRAYDKNPTAENKAAFDQADFERSTKAVEFRKKLDKMLSEIKKEGNYTVLNGDGANWKPKNFITHLGDNPKDIQAKWNDGTIEQFNKSNMSMFEQTMGSLYDLVYQDPSLAQLAFALTPTSFGTSGWFRFGAEVVGYSSELTSTKDRAIEWEHAMQANNARLFLINSAVNKVPWGTVYPAVKRNYKVIGLDKAYDDVLKAANRGNSMGLGWNVYTGHWTQRYFDPHVATFGGVEPSSIVDFNGQNFADKYNIDINGHSTKVMASKTLDTDFNKMLERVKGVKAEARYSQDRANKLAGNKGKFKFFVPYSAEDYLGLVYPTLGKGREGDRNLQWYKDNIVNPFAIGIANYEKAKVESLEQWRNLKKQVSKTPAKLNKEATRGFTNEEAVRVYLWNEKDVVPDTLAKKDVEALVKHVENSKDLTAFAENVKGIVGIEGYPPPNENWISGSLTIDLIDNINTTKRSEFLQQWQDNVDVVYSKDNMNKLKALYGERYTEALENILHRMKTGRNRPSGATRLENQFMNWINDSVGTVMFFNTRSALLQTISSVNFLNWSDNNPLMAGKAFANQPQFWKDFSDLFNSDFLKSRRSGLKNDINADELAKSAASSDNKVRAALSSLLKAGFLPTQIADSFAISIGGASFYRNRYNTYKKDGLSDQEAKDKAMLDFQETAEESQQSSRPDRVSMQQASGLGRVVLAFANTPMQYTRLTKKAALDLINGRGDWKTNMSKILYYGAVQNIIFTALQQAMFAMLFDDDEIDDEEQTEASTKIVNGIADTFLRGSGVGGAAVATMKNIIMEIIKQKESKRPDYTKAALKLTTLSPPVDTKIRKLMSAGRAFTYRQSLKDMNRLGVDIDNPAALATGQVLSAVANLPADRAVLKMRNVKGALDTEHEAWQRIALGLGFSDWQLGIDKDKSDNDKPKIIKFTKPKSGGVKFVKPGSKKSPTKKLERGVAGRANNDGTIEIDPNLSPVEREKTIAHEEQHMEDMKAGKLNYDDNYVYWNDSKYERKNGKIKYKGKSYIEGHKDLPWEKKAYAAEPSTAEAKKRTKLYA